MIRCCCLGFLLCVVWFGRCCVRGGGRKKREGERDHLETRSRERAASPPPPPAKKKGRRRSCAPPPEKKHRSPSPSFPPSSLTVVRLAARGEDDLGREVGRGAHARARGRLELLVLGVAVRCFFVVLVVVEKKERGVRVPSDDQTSARASSRERKRERRRAARPAQPARASCASTPTHPKSQILTSGLGELSSSVFSSLMSRLTTPMRWQ